MFRTLALSTALLLTLDLGTTVLAGASGLSLTAAAQADSGGAKKRIRQNAVRRRGKHTQISTTAESDGDTTAAAIASFELTICSESVGCTDPVEVGQKDAHVGMRSATFIYDDADLPPGTDETTLTLFMLDDNGDIVGAAQDFTVALELGGDLEVEAEDGVDGGTYVSDLRLTEDDCGTGRIYAKVKGEDAASVATLEVIDMDGLLFDSLEVDSCDGLPCVEAEISSTVARFRDNKVDLGAVGDKLADLEEEPVTLSWTLYDSDGAELDSVETEATSKYGDILIDGVPLEFDLSGGSEDPGLFMTTLHDDAESGLSTVTTWTFTDVGAASLDLSMTDASSGKEILSETGAKPVLTRQAFAGGDLEFDSDPSGYTYLVLVDFLNEKGEPVGDQFEAKLVMPSYDAETDTSAWETVVLSDGLGAVGFLADDTGWSAYAWTDDDTLEAYDMELTFEEPFEGPPPLESTINLPLQLPLQQWTHVAVTHTPSKYSVSTNVNDADGTEVDSVEFTGVGPDDGGVVVVYHNRRDGQEEKYMEIIGTDGRFAGVKVINQ